MSTLHVSRIGETNNLPVLVLLHGWGSSSKIWQTCLHQLSKKFQIWCVDLPGHGKSHDVEWDESIDQAIAMLADILPTSCTLIGWSLGGLLAQLFVNKYPQRVHSLMLIASSPKFVCSANWPHAMPLKMFTKFIKQYAAEPEKTLQQFMTLQALHSASPRQVIQALNRARCKQNLRNIAWGLKWLGEIDLRDANFSNHVPLFLLQGENDQVSSVQIAEDTQLIWRQMRVCKIANAAHAPFLSHSKQFIEQVMLMPTGENVPLC